MQDLLSPPIVHCSPLFIHSITYSLSLSPLCHPTSHSLLFPMSEQQYYTSSELELLDRRSLQKLCKRSDISSWSMTANVSIRANAKNSELIATLNKYFNQQGPMQHTEPAPAIIHPYTQNQTASPAPAPSVMQLEDATVDAQPCPVILPSLSDFPPLDTSTDVAERAELAALEAEIGSLEAELVSAQSIPNEFGGRKSRKSTAPGPMVKPMAQEENKPMFTKKKTAEPVKRRAAEPTIAPSATAPITNDPIPTFDFGPLNVSSGTVASTSTFSVAAVMPEQFSAAVAAPAPVVAAASGMDAYFSLMAELDKRVAEKVAAEPDAAIDAGDAALAALNATKTPGPATKKTSV
jgi:hypothetical protein